MRPDVAVAIIGAGPYGLSVAAHLAAHGIQTRIFGDPMRTWRSFMPKGMVLKSEGFASNLSDPSGQFTLGRFCAEQGQAYGDLNWPVPLDVFRAYGEAFQQRLVPHLEPTHVVAVEQVEDSFRLTLATGERVVARSVVVAAGIGSFATIPEVFRTLDPALVTHSSAHGDMARFAGRRVAVIGGGASAMDVAAALHRAGAEPTVISRGPCVKFFDPDGFRSLRDRLLSPMTPLGPGWKKYLCCKLPDVFHRLPAALRHKIISRYLGPSPAWSVRAIIEKHVAVLLNAEVVDAKPTAKGVQLAVKARDGTVTPVEADHVIAATGYRVDVQGIAEFNPALRAAIAQSRGAPALSHWFESSVRNLYFAGPSAAASFGPVLRFVCGTEFAARRIARALARKQAAVPSSQRGAPAQASPLVGRMSRGPA